MTKTATMILFLCVMCSNGFSQETDGKNDGVHREFYEGGKVKFEYMVKDGKLNGFLEKYDEDGKLEYRQYYIDGMFDGVDKDNYYYPLFFWWHHIKDEGPEALLNEEEALERFESGYELADEPLDENWMNVPVTRLPAGRTTGKEFPLKLTGLSKNYIYVKEYQDREDVEPDKHYFYDLVRKYKIRRSDEVDALFNVSSIKEIFKRTHTGVEFGTPFGNRKRREQSRLRSVQQYLGEPEYARPLRPAGWFDVYYEDENLHVVGHGSSVYFMEEARPDWVGSPQYRVKKE